MTISSLRTYLVHTGTLLAFAASGCAAQPASSGIASADTVAAGGILDIAVTAEPDATMTAQIGDQTTPLVADPGAPGQYVGFIVVPSTPGTYDLTVTATDASGHAKTQHKTEHVTPDNVAPSLPSTASIGDTFNVSLCAPGATAADATFSAGQASEHVSLQGDGGGNFTGLASLDSFGTWVADFTITYPDGAVDHRLRAISIGVADVHAQLAPAVGSVSLEGNYVTYDPSLIPTGPLSPKLEQAIADNATYTSKELAAGHLQVEHAPYSVIGSATADLNPFALVPTDAGLALGYFGTQVGLPDGAQVDVEFGWTGLHIKLNKAAIDLISKGTLGAAALAAALGISEPLAVALALAGAMLDVESAISSAAGGDGGVTVTILGYNPLIPPLVTPNF